MSDAVKKWVIGAALAGVLSLAGLFLHYQIKSQVEAQLVAAGYPSREMIVEMKKDIEANRKATELNTKNADKLDSKIERVVQILLEE